MINKNKFLPCLLLVSISFLVGQDIYETDTVFVTASRIESKIYKLPLSSQLLTKTEINNKSIGDIASALSGVAGVDVRNYSLINGASSISLFGSSSQQVLVLLDGLPINSPSIGTPDLGLIPVNILDRIEIVKGPTSSLYGANALGGVVNLISENPFDITKSPSYDIGLSYGSYQTSKLNLSIKDKINGFILDCHRLKTKGLRTNDNGLTQGIGFVNGYVFSSTNKLRLDIRYETKELGLPGPKPDTSMIPIYGDSTSYSRYDRQSDTLFLTKLNSNFQITPDLDIDFNTQYSASNSRFLWVNQYSLDTALYNDHYNTRTMISNLISRYRFSQGTSIAWGLDLAKDYFSAQSEFPPDTQWSPYQTKFGAFTEGSIDFLKNFRVFSSLRFDWNSGFGRFLSPAIGITNTITPYLKIRAHYGRAYRAPTLNDLYWPISGNTNIKSEVGDAYQLGFDLIPNTNFILSSTAFTRKTKNLISWLPDTSNNWRPENIDSSNIVGFELSAKLKLNKLSLQLGGTLQNAKQTRKEMVYYYYDWMADTTKSEFEYKQRKQAFTPDFTFSSGINYQTSFGTDINITGRYSSSRVNYYVSYDSRPDIIIKTKELSPYFVLSLYVSQKILKYAKLSLKIDNILNTLYAEQFGNSIKDNDYPRPTRSIFVGVEIKN